MARARVKISARSARVQRVVTIAPGDNESSETLILSAAQVLSGEIAVQFDANGNVVASSSTDVANAQAYVGITTQAASAIGQQITVRVKGYMEQSYWAWTPEKAIYRGVNGVLTQTAPTSGVMQAVGVAITATKIFVRSAPPILR